MPADGLKKYVEAVPGTPLPHGLLGGCTTVITARDPHELLGTEWRPLSCADASTTTWCLPDNSTVPNKLFARPGICTADPITVYAGSECSTMGFSYEEAVEHATETLRLGEQRALEEWFMSNVLCDVAEDLTPAAGAVSVAQALSVLENWLGSTYGGVGVIHAPVGAGAQFSRDHLAWEEDERLRTLVGNCVVLGAGYAVNVGPLDCTVAPVGEMWLYATSPIRVRRDPPEVIPPTEAGSVDTSLNDRRVLVERTFVAEIACCEAAAIRAVIC